MATPYRFKDGQWEELDKDVEGEDKWFPVDRNAAKVLEGYTQVKDIGQGRLVFYTEDGDPEDSTYGGPGEMPPYGWIMAAPAYDYLVTKVDKAEQESLYPWWGPEVVAQFGEYTSALSREDVAAALDFAQDLQLEGTPGVKPPAEPGSVSPKYWPADILGDYPTQEEATAAGMTVGQLALSRMEEYQAAQGIRASQSGGYKTQADALTARSKPGMENLKPRRDPKTGIWYLDEPEVQKPPGSTNEVMAGLVAKAIQDGNWDAAIQLDDFLKRPSDQQRLEAALAYATSPGDYLTVVGMMRGELPIQAQPGGFGRIAPPADFLQQAAQKYFGFGQGQGATTGFGAQPVTASPGQRPALGARTQTALPPGGAGTQTAQETQMFLDNPSMFDPNYDTASPEAQQAILAEIKQRGATTDTGQPSGPRMDETEISPGVFFSPTTGTRIGGTPEQRDLNGVSPERQAIQDAMKLPFSRSRLSDLRGERFRRGFNTSESATGVGAGDYVPTAQDLATPAWADAYARYNSGRPQLTQGASNAFGQFPSHIQQALGSEILTGKALTPRKTLPELGALRFPSAQALRTMTPTERAFFVQALKEQGVSGSNLDTYNEQLNRTIRPAGGRQAQYGFATGRI